MSTQGEHSNRRAAAFAAVLGTGLFATLAAAVMARNLVAQSYADQLQPFVAWLPNNTALCLSIMAAFSLVIGVAAYLLFTRFTGIQAALQRLQGPRFLALTFTPRSIAVAAVLIFVLWVPILIIMYPTGLTVDTYNQLYQFQTHAPTFYPTTEQMIDAEFIDHHPVFDTLLYGLFWQIGAALGNQNAGLFVLVILQSVVLAAILSTLTCYLQRLHVPWLLRVATLLFFAWFPFFGHYAATVLKDVTYLTVFIPWMLLFVEACRTRGKLFSDTRVLVAFMVLGGLCILSKKLGVFVLVVCLVVLIVALRGQRARLVVGSVATLLVFCALLPAVVYPAVGGVAAGGRQEALGPAIHQVTALAQSNPSALSESDQETVNKVFDLQRAVDAYEAPRSDTAKETFHPEATTQDILNFMGVWAAQGIKHPVDYMRCTAQTAGMLFIPFMKLTYYNDIDTQDRAAVYSQTNPEFAVNVQRPANLVELSNQLEFNSVESAISDLPFISLFFTSGFYGGWIPFIALIVVLFARKGARRRAGAADAATSTATRAATCPLLLTALVPALVTVAFFLVSPVASPRYVLPLMYCAPLLLGWAWFSLHCTTQESVHYSS